MSVASGVAIARHTLRSVEAYVPTNQHEREMKLLNIRQLRAFLGMEPMPGSAKL